MAPNIEFDYGNPVVVIVLSGKRKTGKDYVANLLLERFGSDKAMIIRLSGPLKERYAQENDLDYEKLLDASDYKETYRQKMIQWGEEIRSCDPGYFCHHAILQSKAKSKEIWIVSDARRESDVNFFLTHFGNSVYLVRIQASEETRILRGWKYTNGVDDRESECGLDEYKTWNFVLNNNSGDELLKGMNEIWSNIQMLV